MEKISPPKRPLSAYMMFAIVKRPQLKEENPSLKFGEVGRKLGEMWKELSDEEYKNRYIREKKEYEKLMIDDDNNSDSDNN